MKRLPLGENETIGVEHVSTRKIISRWFSIESMFFGGVVARAILHRNFYAHILLEKRGDRPPYHS